MSTTDTIIPASLEADLRQFVKDWRHVAHRARPGRGVMRMLKNFTHTCYGLQVNGKKMRALACELGTDNVRHVGPWRQFNAPQWDSALYADLAEIAEKVMTENSNLFA